MIRLKKIQGLWAVTDEDTRDILECFTGSGKDSKSLTRKETGKVFGMKKKGGWRREKHL